MNHLVNGANSAQDLARSRLNVVTEHAAKFRLTGMGTTRRLPTAATK